MLPVSLALERLHGEIADSATGEFSEEQIAKLESAYQDSLHEFIARLGLDWPSIQGKFQLAFEEASHARHFAELVAGTSAPACPRAPSHRGEPETRLTPDAFLEALTWVCDERKPKFRGGKATVFVLECWGLHMFPGCKTADEVFTQQGVARATGYAWRRELRTAGARLGSPLPEESRPNTNLDGVTEREVSAPR